MKRLGVFQLGCNNVAFNVDKNITGAHFYLCPSSMDLPYICVGLNQNWYMANSSLHHEANEFAATRIECRFKPDLELSKDNGCYMFMMTHYQFAEMCAAASEFIEKATPLLKKAWTKANKKGKPK